MDSLMVRYIPHVFGFNGCMACSPCSLLFGCRTDSHILHRLFSSGRISSLLDDMTYSTHRPDEFLVRNNNMGGPHVLEVG